MKRQRVLKIAMFFAVAIPLTLSLWPKNDSYSQPTEKTITTKTIVVSKYMIAADAIYDTVNEDRANQEKLSRSIIKDLKKKTLLRRRLIKQPDTWIASSPKDTLQTQGTAEEYTAEIQTSQQQTVPCPDSIIIITRYIDKPTFWQKITRIFKHKNKTTL